MAEYTSDMLNEQEMAELLEETYLDAAAVQVFTTLSDRRLPFSGAKNFRDLGGYQTMGGKSLRWGMLYRSDSLHKLTDADLKRLSDLDLDRIIDFRSPLEKEKEPDRLPVELAARLVAIPILDSSTQIYQHSRDEFVKNLKNIDAVQSMVQTNVELATCFTLELRMFLDVLLSSNGRPILFHCAAGKDRTGFAAAILLRILEVPHDMVMEDYLLSNRYFLAAHRWGLYLLRILKGKRFAEAVVGMVRVHPLYLSAAFQAIDRNHGSFENYVCSALGLTARDVEHLKSLYLE
jgi:protein-tyrosine phosphatase